MRKPIPWQQYIHVPTQRAGRYDGMFGQYHDYGPKPKSWGAKRGVKLVGIVALCILVLELYLIGSR